MFWEVRVFPPCPQPPDWSIDWASLDQLPWLVEMKGCPQNRDRHAEGDVWNHVHLVVEALVGLPAWRALPAAERQILFAAALLHDVAKPLCTRLEPDGRVTARGHSWRGAVHARAILWRCDVPFAEREAICAVVRHHLVPFFLAESANPQRLAIEVSQTARCDLLAIMAEADVRGRICPDPQKMLEQIDRFREQASAAECWTNAFAFPTEQARVQYFRYPQSTATAAAADGHRCRVVMMSGLPSAGKDHWIENDRPDCPVISIDAIRQQLGVPPRDPQGIVLDHARAQAIDYLRNECDFIWNAPCLSRNIRHESLRLFDEHKAHVRIVYVESSYGRLLEQNRLRPRRVPEQVIERMLERWEVPDRTEAHQVEYIIHTANGQPDAATTR